MYVDLGNTFKTPPSLDVEAIGNSLRNLINTRKGTVPGKPEYGSNIGDLLFEPFSVLNKMDIITELEMAIRTWEPRIEIINIDVTENVDYNSLDLFIYYRIVFTGDEYDLNIRLKNS